MHVYGLDGKLIYENSLNDDVLETSIQLCRELSVDVVGYAAEGAYVTHKVQKTFDILDSYQEAAPTVFPEGLSKLKGILETI